MSLAVDRKKILIVISDFLFVRNYLTTAALNEVNKNNDCFYLVNQRVSDDNALKRLGHVSFYETCPQNSKKHYRLLDLMMWRYRHLSSSFLFRAKRAMKMRLGLPDGAKLWVRCAKWILQNFNALRKFFDYHIFANRLTYPAVSYYCRSQLSLNVSLCSGVKKVLPDLVVFPSSAYDPDGIDLVEICNSLNIETLFLVDNWDNLSSKSILWRKPTYLGVWGQQSVDHAVEIQGFPRKCVFPIGTPRYENYFSLRTQKLTPPFDFPYVLFVGTALAFDEASVLIRLDSLIESTRSLSGLKIVYRPHPWRQGTDSIAGCNLKHVVIDPQVESNYLNRKHSVDFQPSLDYYPGLIKNSLFVLGGLTSMLIEASIFYKKFVALVHDDEANFTSPHNALKYYAHFQKLERVSSIVFCRHLNDLDKIFADTFSSRSQVDRQQIDEQRTYFLYCDEKTYGQRLGELCASLLLSQKNLEHDSSAHCC